MASSILSNIKATLIASTTPDQSEPWSNGNEGVIRTSPGSRIKATPSDVV